MFRSLRRFVRQSDARLLPKKNFRSLSLDDDGDDRVQSLYSQAESQYAPRKSLLRGGLFQVLRFTIQQAKLLATDSIQGTAIATEESFDEFQKEHHKRLYSHVGTLLDASASSRVKGAPAAKVEPIASHEEQQERFRTVTVSNDFSRHPLVIFSALAGIPTVNYTWDLRDSRFPMRKNFLLNLSAWYQPSSPRWQKIVALLPFIAPLWPILAVIKHVSFIIPNLLLNALKLVTEVLPSMLVALFSEALNARARASDSLDEIKSETIRESSGLTPVGHAIFGAAKLALLGVRAVFTILYAASIALLFVGRAITSPLASAKELWAMSQVRLKDESVEETVWNDHTQRNETQLVQRHVRNPDSALSRPEFLGYKALAILSGLLTFAIYTTLAIMLLPYIAGVALVAPEWMPSFISTGLGAAFSVFSGFASIAAPFFAPIGAVVASMLAGFGPAALVSNAFLGLAAATGFALAAAATVGSQLVDMFTNWYNRKAIHHFVEKVETDQVQTMNNPLYQPGGSHGQVMTSPVVGHGYASNPHVVVVQQPIPQPQYAQPQPVYTQPQPVQPGYSTVYNPSSPTVFAHQPQRGQAQPQSGVSTTPGYGYGLDSDDDT